MPSSLAARGVSGDLKFGYHVIARLSDWTLDQTGRIDARSSDVNPFWLEHASQPIVRLQVGKRFWVWSSVDVIVLDDHACSLRVNGSPEVRD